MQFQFIKVTTSQYIDSIKEKIKLSYNLMSKQP